MLSFSGMAATKLDLIENRRTELQAAFLAFGSVSEQLSGAFDSLRTQVAQLRTELGEAHAGKEHLAARLSALIKGLPGGVLVLDSGGEIRRNDHRRDVAVAQRRAVHVEAQVLEHRLDGLLRERRVAHGVAGTLKTDYEAIANQLAVARATQDRNILDANRCRGRGGKANHQCEK